MANKNNNKPSMSDMRLFVMAAYPSLSWKDRLAKMYPRQVAAIYRKMKKKEENEKKYHQIDMWEYMAYLSNKKRKEK